MGERKAQQKYYPPDFDPNKHKSLNAYRGVKGKSTVRFEMPFHVWCEGCGRMIGAGVRFNAQKYITGKYLSSDIFRFSMECADCKQELIIETDPQNTDYKCISGLRKKIVTYSTSDMGVVQLNSSLKLQKVYSDEEIDVNDPMTRLELLLLDLNIGEQSQSVIEEQMRVNVNRKDVSESNQNLKKWYRSEYQSPDDVKVNSSVSFKSEEERLQRQKDAQKSLRPMLSNNNDQYQQQNNSRQSAVIKEIRKQTLLKSLGVSLFGDNKRRKK